MWVVIGLVFFILSLGPELLWYGDPLKIGSSGATIPLPYAFLNRIFPLLQLSGVPARMAVMPLMVVSLLAGFGVKYLFRQRKVLILVALLLFAIVESIPKIYNPLETSFPKTASALAKAPRGVLLDRANTQTKALYYQIQHQQPLVDGALARISKQNYDYSRNLAIGQSTDTKLLCQQFQIRYIWSLIEIDNHVPIFSDGHSYLYDINPDGACAE